jgi:hypothetical protein
MLIKKVAAIALALALVSCQVPLRDAQAGQWPPIPSGTYADIIFPPPEYDKPFAGRVIETTVTDMNQMAQFCSPYLWAGSLAGCARRIDETQCYIFIAPRDYLLKQGLVPSQVRRHEIGHCNGWRHEESILELADQNTVASEPTKCIEGCEEKPQRPHIVVHPRPRVWQCNDLRAVLTEREGSVDFDVSGTLWGGGRFTVALGKGLVWELFFNGRPCLPLQPAGPR